MAKQMLVSCAKSGCNQMVILDLEPAKTIEDVRRELKNAFWDSRIESGVEYDLCPMHRILAEIKPDRFEYVIHCSPMGGGSHVDDTGRKDALPEEFVQSPNCIGGCHSLYAGMCGPCYRLNRMKPVASVSDFMAHKRTKDDL